MVVDYVRKDKMINVFFCLGRSPKIFYLIAKFDAMLLLFPV